MTLQWFQSGENHSSMTLLMSRHTLRFNGQLNRYKRKLLYSYLKIK